jgi:hypothetical protein
MNLHGILENSFGLIRGTLVSSPGPLDCAFCGKRETTIGQAIMRRKTDDVPVCRSCFNGLLKQAARLAKGRAAKE